MPTIKFLPKRLYIVWQMLVEEFQDGCLVHSHLLYLNGRILAILSFKGHKALKMLFEEFHEGCSVHGHRWYQSLID